MTTLNENPTDSNLVRHAITELDLIGETSYEEPSMRKAVLDIVRVFSEQGHSGSSAAWCVGIVEKVLRFQPLSPLTDNSAQWMEVTEGLWQSRRDPEAFSDDAGKTYSRNSEPDVVHASEPSV